MKKHLGKSWFPRMSISSKMMLISIAILLPTLLFLLLVYGYWSAFVRQQSFENFDIMNRQLMQTVEDNIEQKQIIVRTLCESSKVQEMIRSKGWDASKQVYTDNVKPVLEAVTETSSHGQMLWIIRYDAGGYEDISNDYEGILSNVKRSTLEIEKGLKEYAVLSASRVSRQKWFRELKGNLEEYKVQRINMDYLNHCFSIIAEIKEDGQAIGMVRLISPLKDLIGEEAEALEKEGSNVFVLDAECYLISTKQWKRKFMVDNWELFQRIEERLQHGKQYQEMNEQWIVSADKLGDTGFYLVVMNSAQPISEKNQQLRNVLLFCMLMIFLLVSIFTLGTSRYLSGRLLHLLKAMQRFQDGNLDDKVTVRSGDEIGKLYLGYNQMTERISELMDRNIEMAREKEKSELSMLQMQINPHFLYNSLSTIQRLAEFGETKRIKEMVFALTQFYRLSLNKGKQFYTVRDEIQQIEAYLRIFSLRKGEVFSCKLDVAQEGNDYYIPKLILQPFVENIFQHAFDETHTYVNIGIRLRIEEELVFTVEDDGCGMCEEVLEELRVGTYERKESGFGMKNVMSRLSLIYGERHRFLVESQEDEGTKVTIRLPKQGRKEIEIMMNNGRTG